MRMTDEPVGWDVGARGARATRCLLPHVPCELSQNLVVIPAISILANFFSRRPMLCVTNTCQGEATAFSLYLSVPCDSYAGRMRISASCNTALMVPKQA